ncbi:SAM-dependent methyltransferase [Streptomyces sp. NPDC006463]|uniref:SAM-dependent methyltransferase n=1 Tax=Streptomyces sp. NPDC006463 TaxID=3364746 RepID=UPI0036B8D210
MDLQTFRALLTDEGRSLLAALQETGPGGAPSPSATAALRRSSPPALVAAAEEQVLLRGQAAAKFGEFAPRMYLTPDFVELSSHLAVAEYKLDRVLDEVGVVLIDAICLGSGLDALVLSWSHHTTAVDSDPLTVEIAEANAPVANASLFFPHRGDTAAFDSQGEAVFIDLMRRPGPDGAHDPESYSPPLSWALDRVRTTGLGWVRLAPGLAPGAVPDLGRADEAEWISYAGTVQELVLWFGLLPKPAPVTARKATLLPAGVSLTARGLPEPSVRPLGRYVYVPDPAVVHAGLVAEVAEDIAGGPLDGGGALLTSDELRQTPFATAYEVTEVLPRGGGGRPRTTAEKAPEAPEAPPAEFVVAGADGPTTLLAVPVRFPQAP